MIFDLCFAFRQLFKSPAFTLVAIVTLGLGIAANTAIFSVVDAVLLHPLPYPESDRIVSVSQTVRSTGVSAEDASPANFIDWQAQNSIFSVMAASRGWNTNLAGAEQPERIYARMASASFFRLFEVPAFLGRVFDAEDAKPGKAHVAVLSYGLWNRRYGADRNLIGHDILLDGEKYSVIGVMPPNFAPDDEGALWVPSPFGVPTHPLAPNDDPRSFRDRSYLDAWGRLKPGVSLQQAQAEMSAIARRLEQQYPDSNKDEGVTLVPMHEQWVAGLRPMILMLSGAVSLVLLIACANVANLLLARAAARSREMAIRTALGASRRRLIRQLLTESTVLALLGMALGVLLATWALPILLSFAPPQLTDFAGIGLNREVLAFSLLASILTGTLFGLAPALFASRVNPNESLREGERGSSLGQTRGRALLISGEIALSLVLLVSAGLMLKSFVRLMQVDPGFNPDRLLIFNTGLPASTEGSKQVRFFDQMIRQVAAVPGVQSVGAVSRLPLAGGNSSRSFNVPGRTQDYEADVRVCTPDYFGTMAIPLLRGRNFSEHDTAASPPVALINAATAENAFPGEDPIGKHVTNFGPQSLKLQIIGVIGNVRHVTLEKGPRPEIYVPLAQMQWPSMFVAVRSGVSNPLSLLPAMQSAVWSVDRDVPLAHPRTMQDVLAHSVLRRKFAMLLLSIFAALATLLAAIGLYGVISYSVAQRTKEIGIRMALGGQRSDMLRMILRQSGILVLAGMLIGVPIAFGATHLLGTMLYGVGPIDFMTYLLVVTLLGAAAFLASILPALRATKVDPMTALRYE
ncbi:MAG TPA: ABC transporter permease [Chthoniobacterales bacterium]|nr:ABC transporter permease [Chthoniobacterales bacterium]